MMVRRPVVHGPATTVRELRAFFRDDHVHMALLVDGGKLVAAIARADLAHLSEESPVRLAVPLDVRTIAPDASLAEALARMRQTSLRRLAVINDEGTLLGLLCLKASGRGFCTDDNIAQRRATLRPAQR